MRRALFALAVTACTVLALALAGPASAAPGQVTHVRFSGKSAEAFWETATATGVTDTSVNASTSKHASRLFVVRLTSHFGANPRRFTGATETIANVTRGFSFTLRHSLASASLSGSGLPATTCTYDAHFNPTGCRATTIHVTVTWTGHGPISRDVSTDHCKSDGFRVHSHFNGTFRDATANGTVAGHPVSASQLQFADLSITKAGYTTVGIGSGC
jgi:hypothetical protein